MPKPRRVLDLNARHNLHECLQRKASMQLKTKSNCERLATKMRKENCAVSASTLYRIFLDSKSETRPFINTLNEIVKYLGFDDYDTFKKWSQKNTNIGKNTFDKEIPELSSKVKSNIQTHSSKRREIDEKKIMRRNVTLKEPLSVKVHQNKKLLENITLC